MQTEGVDIRSVGNTAVSYHRASKQTSKPTLFYAQGSSRDCFGGDL